MGEGDIRSKIVDLICEVSMLDEIDPSGYFLKEDFGLDSLTITQLIVRMEEVFSMEIDIFLIDPDNMNTVDDMYRIAEITLESTNNGKIA